MDFLAENIERRGWKQIVRIAGYQCSEYISFIYLF